MKQRYFSSKIQRIYVSIATISLVLFFILAVWMPITNPSPGLLFDYYSKNENTVKVYFDTGSGLNEGDSYQKAVPDHDKWIPIRLDLPAKVIRNLRLDPATSPIEAQIRNLRVVDATGAVRETIFHNDLKPNDQIILLEENDDHLVFATTSTATDPQLHISLDQNIDLRIDGWRVVWLDLHLFVEEYLTPLLYFLFLLSVLMTIAYFVVLHTNSLTRFRNLRFSRSTDFIQIWWFAGLVVVIYTVLKDIFQLQRESLEWGVYIVSGLLVVIYYFLRLTFGWRINTHTRLLLTVIFVVFLWKEEMISLLLFTRDNRINVGSFVLIIPPLVLWSTRYFSKKLLDRRITVDDLLHFFILINLASRLVFWKDFYVYLEYWAVAPVLFTATILISAGLFLNYRWAPIDRYWWVAPAVLFFFESFRTYGLFEKGNGALHHWQIYVGPLEMMAQGGYLLWDVPSQYGFLNLIVAKLIPASNSWQKVYVLNSLLQLGYSLLVFKVIWQNKNLVWYIVSILLTLSVVFYLPGNAKSLVGSAIYPSVGAMRFFWVALLLYVITSTTQHPWSKVGVFKILPIWLIGFLWSAESAFYMTSIVGAYGFCQFLSVRETQKNAIQVFLLFPAVLIVVISVISIWFFVKLGHLPDYFSFYEHAFAFAEGYGKLPVLVTGLVWVPIFIFSILISNDENRARSNYSYFILFIGLWAIFSYFVARSAENNVTNILVLFIFSIFLATRVMDTARRERTLLLISPLLVIILTIAFGGPSSITHIKNTYAHQNYRLTATLPSESVETNSILTKIKPGELPVIFIEPRRQEHFISRNEYIDIESRIKQSLSRRIWLPFYPASLVSALPLERQIKYLNRWIGRHPVDAGWVINEKNQSLHDAALLTLLGKYRLAKREDFGELKALLYERKKDR